MDMGSRRMQIVGIVLAVLMAALLAVTLPGLAGGGGGRPHRTGAQGGGCGAPG